MESEILTKVISMQECLKELEDIETATSTIETISPEAGWYIKGIIYHGRNLIKCYCDIVDGTIKRINTVGAVDALIMYTPSAQSMMFEFYALINILRISLDALRKLLSPAFITPISQLPKSITDFKSGTTNCPIYENLAKCQDISYLIEIRNCAVHFRGFTTLDNTVAIREDSDMVISELDSEWISSITKASYRIEENRLIFNIYLPDKIFTHEQNGNKKLAEFTYSNKLNIISKSMNFIRIVSDSYLEASTYANDKIMLQRFEFKKNGL